jgi:hypothetical protein
MIENLAEGKVVGYADMGIKSTDYPAAAKAVSRMVKSGLLERASAGLFYKPKKTVFGELKPQEEQLIRPYLYEKGRRVAYITGTSLYNQMGLTTQVPAVIQVASQSKRIRVTVGNVRIKAVKSYIEVNEDNYQLLELLDAIKDFKQIPDLEMANGLKILRKKLVSLSPQTLKQLVSIALNYPPRTRAMTGAILDWAGKPALLIRPLRESLNVLTSFDLGISQTLLPTGPKWKIN